MLLLLLLFICLSCVFVFVFVFGFFVVVFFVLFCSVFSNSRQGNDFLFFKRDAFSQPFNKHFYPMDEDRLFCFVLFGQHEHHHCN